MRSPDGAWRWLLAKEWHELTASRAFWVLLFVMGPLVGVITSDKQTIHYVDNAGGHVTGKFTGPGRFEGCYLRPGRDVMVAACNLFTKQ